MNYENIIFEVAEGMAVITMNRPKALNSLNSETLADLSAAVKEVAANNEIKGLIITGAGKAFVAGADIVQMKEYNGEEARKYAAFGQSVFSEIETLEKPVIAAVNGYALGGGNELCMSCDIRIASEKAVFGQPEVNLGILPFFGGTQRLSRLVGAGRAKELVFTGAYIKADEAHRIGLANKVVEQDKLMDTAKEMMNTIFTKSPIGVKYGKVAINKGLDMDINNAFELETSFAGLCFSTEDQTEGMNAFVEKRAAKFSNK